MCAARAESLAFALIVLSAESYYAAEMQSSPRAIAYLRVSTEQQADSGLGLEAQQASGSAAANRIGLTLAETFSDAGISGSLAIEARPVLLDAVAALQRADAVVRITIGEGNDSDECAPCTSYSIAGSASSNERPRRTLSWKTILWETLVFRPSFHLGV